MIHKVLNWFTKAISMLCGAMVGILLVINLLAVVMRYVFSAPLFWCEEVSLLLFMWFVALALIPLTYQRRGIALDFFVDLLKPTPKKILRIVVDTLGAVLLVMVTSFGVELMRRSLYRFTPILHIPYRYIYLSLVVAMAISAAIHLLYAVEDTLSLIREKRGCKA